MTANTETAIASPPATPAGESLPELLKRHFLGEREVRRGVCLLSAGDYAAAAECFSGAAAYGYKGRSLASLLAACCLGEGRSAAAVDYAEQHAQDHPKQTASQIRLALTLWSTGCQDEALNVLREEIRQNPEHAGLHYHLGTLLASIDQHEEAELRFTQAVNIDRNYTEAIVSLGLCCAVRDAPGDAIRHLERAQAQRPHDARIGLLLAQAARATKQQGGPVRVRATMPEDQPADDDRSIEELAEMIRQKPDFVDGFLSIPLEDPSDRVFEVLLEALQVALRHQPPCADLHYQCGRVLQRLGRNDDAVHENERAVEIDLRSTRALIQLGKLYAQMSGTDDAATRLGQAIASGADFADVHYLLGNLHQKQGRILKARQSYRRALKLNEGYLAAHAALKALPAAS